MGERANCAGEVLGLFFSHGPSSLDPDTIQGVCNRPVIYVNRYDNKTQLQRISPGEVFSFVVSVTAKC